MSRESQVRQQLGFVNGGHCLNRLVLDNDALGHDHVDAITRLDLDAAVPYGQGNFAADLDTPATKFMGQACLIRRFHRPGPKARCTLSMASTTCSAVCSISSFVLFIASSLCALRVFAVGN